MESVRVLVQIVKRLGIQKMCNEGFVAVAVWWLSVVLLLLWRKVWSEGHLCGR